MGLSQNLMILPYRKVLNASKQVITSKISCQHVGDVSMLVLFDQISTLGKIKI